MCSAHTNRPWWLTCDWCDGCTLQRPCSNPVIFHVLRTLMMTDFLCVAQPISDVNLRSHSITVRLKIVRIILFALVPLLPENTVHYELHDLYSACFHCSSGIFHICLSPHEHFHPIYLKLPSTVFQAAPFFFEKVPDIHFTDLLLHCQAVHLFWYPIYLRTQIWTLCFSVQNLLSNYIDSQSCRIQILNKRGNQRTYLMFYAPRFLHLLL